MRATVGNAGPVWDAGRRNRGYEFGGEGHGERSHGPHWIAVSYGTGARGARLDDEDDTDGHRGRESFEATVGTAAPAQLRQLPARYTKKLSISRRTEADQGYS